MLQNKTGVILGVANKRSIAWAIASACDRAGARLALTYQNERMRRNLETLAGELRQPPLLLPCDVTKADEVANLVAELRKGFQDLDFLVHAIAYARKEDLEGPFHGADLEGWRVALEVSAYSFTSLVRAALPLCEERAASFLTLTYLGGERVVPNYNVMGVAKAALESSVRYLAGDVGPLGHRVNALSAGPIKTLAASGVSGFSRMLDEVAQRSPLRRNVTADEVGDASVFYLSPMSRGITGTVAYVDCGFHIMGL